MPQQNKLPNFLPVLLIIAGLLVAALAWLVVRTKSNQPIPIAVVEELEMQTPAIDSPQQSIAEKVEKNEESQTLAPPKTTLTDIAKTAWGWNPAFQKWYGKTAPDITLIDLAGKTHKLSDYHGKDVMMVIWATWCGPCKEMIPHLIALQNRIGNEKLAILAVSYITFNNTTKMIKGFVSRNRRINYSVFPTDIRAVPSPYNQIEGIPCVFFIDPEGKIKFATEGQISFGLMKAILAAR